MHHSNKGFTLIELLVVIAIIGLLASVVLVSLNKARAKARDARRQSDLDSIKVALELYYDNHNSYPTGGFDTCSGVWSGTFAADLAPYMSKVPVDPLNIVGGGCATNYYYAFWNPVTWNFSATCPAGSIVLYAPGESSGFASRDDCNVNFLNIKF